MIRRLLMPFAVVVGCFALFTGIARIDSGFNAGIGFVPDVALATVPAKCVEGQACWNWAIYGNRKRGVNLVSDRRVIAGPCRFSRLYRQARIVLVGQQLHGDWWAINHGCEWLKPHIGTALTMSSDDA